MKKKFWHRCLCTTKLCNWYTDWKATCYDTPSAIERPKMMCVFMFYTIIAATLHRWALNTH